MPSAYPPPDWILIRRLALGARIRAVRQEARMTQETVALNAGLDRPSLVKIEAGKQSPSADTLFRIAEALGVSVRDLF
ncbi:helix-turn-helix transcriptional regulator [Streptomyces sp. NPDC050439]|uniref:helix-turn-helix domain-containing protein n=1 Tax=unclassified Streptomyces TaxID=2593676 RepID=UPI00344305D7